MAYILIGVSLLLQGLLLLGASSEHQLRGVKMFIWFGQYKDLAGVLFVIAGYYLLRRGISGPKPPHTKEVPGSPKTPPPS